MRRNFKKAGAAIIAASMMISSMPMSALADQSQSDDLVVKTATEISEGEYKIKLKVPGQDGEELHDEVILMVDGSYSGDDEWNGMVDAIVGIGETVLNGNGNTQLTLMAFGMGDNEVLVHAKNVDELEDKLGSLPGSLLYGRSSTNCEAGFTGVAEYIDNHDESLNDVYVIYISDGEINTDETPHDFYNWKDNTWLRWSSETIIEANFLAELDNLNYVKANENRLGFSWEEAISDALSYVFGDRIEDLMSAVASSSNAVKRIVNEVTDEMGIATDSDARYVYNDQVWADVYDYSDLIPGEEYPVSDVERAFAKYDKEHNTYLQDNFYYTLVGRSYPNITGRTKEAAAALGEQVDSLYIIDNNETTAWMKNAENATFIPAGSIANIIPAMEDVLTDLSWTPFNDVVVTDYMSKWVNLDTTSLAIVDDTKGETIWTAANGWTIAEADRPTAQEVPVVVELVDPSGYALGGPDVEGNTNGDIYKLTWYVKDGAMLRSENYHLEYDVTVDTEEEGYVHGTNYPANGITTVEYEDENGDLQEEDIKVPDVKTPEQEKPEDGDNSGDNNGDNSEDGNGDNSEDDNEDNSQDEEEDDSNEEVPSNPTEPVPTEPEYEPEPEIDDEPEEVAPAQEPIPVDVIEIEENDTPLGAFAIEDNEIPMGVLPAMDSAIPFDVAPATGTKSAALPIAVTGFTSLLAAVYVILFGKKKVR